MNIGRKVNGAGFQYKTIWLWRLQETVKLYLLLTLEICGIQKYCSEWQFFKLNCAVLNLVWNSEKSGESQTMLDRQQLTNVIMFSTWMTPSNLVSQPLRRIIFKFCTKPIANDIWKLLPFWIELWKSIPQTPNWYVVNNHVTCFFEEWISCQFWTLVTSIWSQFIDISMLSELNVRRCGLFFAF